MVRARSSVVDSAAAFFTALDSPLGLLHAFHDGQAISSLWFDAPPSLLQTAVERPHDGVGAALSAYFGGGVHEYEQAVRALAFAPRGTAFQTRVWALLDAIPFGAARTYGELASDLGQTTASRAVGRANATNPLAILRPCHRVIGANGSLTGYAGGLERKAWLLDWERQCTGQTAGLPLFERDD